MMAKGILVMNGQCKIGSEAYVTPGMPVMDTSGSPVSFFEFWPTWIMYLPVVALWLLMSIRYRSWSLPLVANPRLPLSGMVGGNKSLIFTQTSPYSRQWILPWVTHTVVEGTVESQMLLILEAMKQREIVFPVVGKPDIGCRGVGVKLLKDRVALASYLQSYPIGGELIIQQLSSWEPEAGVFYVRYPGQLQGKIISMAFKYSPYVIGDGVSTLAQLILADSRASQLKHLYFPRFQHQLDCVLNAGEPFRLVFSASHCRGAIFRDGSSCITEALNQRLDDILKGIPEFYFGRLDIKFRSITALQRGEDIEIVEINGASSESLHIWDRKTRFSDAITALLQQYLHLFRIGANNRDRGHRPPGLWPLWRAWRREKYLTEHYPEND